MDQKEFKNHLDNWTNNLNNVKPEEIDKVVSEFVLSGYDGKDNTHRANIVAANNLKALISR